MDRAKPWFYQENMWNESLIIFLLVGLVAGFLASQMVRGGGLGLVGDLVIGVLGAFVGNWLMKELGYQIGRGTLALLINATIGAVALLLLVRLVRRI